MDRYLDFWNLMAYDFAGAWDATSGHQANIYSSSTDPCCTPFSADAAVKAYIAGGGSPVYYCFCCIRSECSHDSTAPLARRSVWTNVDVGDIRWREYTG
ncbi:hypothetical protein BZA05DRAFT_394804 [Tricharina praecox]|uniref:uncharacterized protein n=1 Tax=Tricharina praecox TaxID=43433 RepID=UPI002220AE3A|nr:uncharacterized protein BZA05DRAFT_394804 [Tricharina praecox]KAI5853815.1 hypothetical protein BZA05DRAFT_394804 [Tricharina praecox]